MGLNASPLIHGGRHDTFPVSHDSPTNFHEQIRTFKVEPVTIIACYSDSLSSPFGEIKAFMGTPHAAKLSSWVCMENAWKSIADHYANKMTELYSGTLRGRHFPFASVDELRPCFDSDPPLTMRAEVQHLLVKHPAVSREDTIQGLAPAVKGTVSHRGRLSSMRQDGDCPWMACRRLRVASHAPNPQDDLELTPRGAILASPSVQWMPRWRSLRPQLADVQPRSPELVVRLNQTSDIALTMSSGASGRHTYVREGCKSL